MSWPNDKRYSTKCKVISYIGYSRKKSRNIFDNFSKEKNSSGKQMEINRRMEISFPFTNGNETHIPNMKIVEYFQIQGQGRGRKSCSTVEACLANFHAFSWEWHYATPIFFFVYLSLFFFTSNT